ncbi:hypothetical protein [Sulfitobacter dubius]|uniref:Uncharacterized protein n=1 Tax=Sulfitobacter dubius TaxID=218673 RepID=A0ABY3ZJ59_9RHOB|nr:hypothetical protein [Sulfitobacter dubius]UOA14517.1 hypothetical protein DSM109990_01323 [Sulfitobacter dubius]
MAATVEGWIAYAALRGDTVADDQASAAALVRGQDYIDLHYVNRFGSAVRVDEKIVEKAIYEAAKLELATPGFWSKTYTPNQQKVLTAVGEIKWTVRGDASGPDAATPVSTKIDSMLRPYMAKVTGMFVL